MIDCSAVLVLFEIGVCESRKRDLGTIVCWLCLDLVDLYKVGLYKEYFVVGTPCK